MIKKTNIAFLFLILLCSCGVKEEEKYILPIDSENSLVNKKNIVTSTEDSIQSVYHKISADEALSIMKLEESFILLDVRTEEEYEEKRIDGAVLIPDFEIAECAESKLLDKNVVILVYCRTGRRSANAAKELISMGYTNVYDFGGIVDWPYETVGD